MYGSIRNTGSNNDSPVTKGLVAGVKNVTTNHHIQQIHNGNCYDDATPMLTNIKLYNAKENNLTQHFSPSDIKGTATLEKNPLDIQENLDHNLKKLI